MFLIATCLVVLTLGTSRTSLTRLSRNLFCRFHLRHVFEKMLCCYRSAGGVEYRFCRNQGLVQRSRCRPPPIRWGLDVRLLSQSKLRRNQVGVKVPPPGAPDQAGLKLRFCQGERFVGTRFGAKEPLLGNADKIGPRPKFPLMGTP